MTSRAPGRPQSVRALAFAVACLALCGSMGCSTLRPAGSLPTGDPIRGAGVEVRVFEDRRAHEAARLGPRRVVGVLERSGHGGWRRVFRTSCPNWVVRGLAPGEYRVRIPAILDEEGREVPIAELRRVFRVRSGAITRLDAILRNPSPVRKVLGFLGKAALFVGAVAVDDRFGDEPDAVEDPHGLYEPARVGDFVLEELAESGGGDHGGGAAAGLPIVLSHFPPNGAVVAGGGVRAIVALSAPLAEGTVDHRAVVVTREDGAGVPGDVTYDRRRWWLVWRPDAPLPAGETLTVTVDLPGATDWLGTDLGGISLFTFRAAAPAPPPT